MKSNANTQAFDGDFEIIFSDSFLHYSYPNKIKKNKFHIIDADVFNRANENCALSKNHFAELVESGGIKVDDGEFLKIFSVVRSIILAKNLR